jgi:hypothetical protein
LLGILWNTLSLCVCVPPSIIFWFSVWSMSYQRKERNLFFPEFLVVFSIYLSVSWNVSKLYLKIKFLAHRILCLHYRDQTYRKTVTVYCEKSYETHKYTLWAECRVFVC